MQCVVDPPCTSVVWVMPVYFIFVKKCIKPESPGNKITVIMDDKTLTTQDNGRGIPTNMLRVIMETNQAGSNMTRAGGMTKGENGSGFTTYTAMSSFLEVISLRPTEKKK